MRRTTATETGGSRILHAYLVELARHLDVPWRLRRRVLAETADHLLEAAEGERRRGRRAPAAEQAAIARFGEAATVAGRFVEQLAVTSVHRATDAVAAVLVGLCVAAWPFLGMTVPGTPDFPRVAVVALAAQVAVVAGGLGVLRSAARRPAATIPAGELRLLVRGNATALAAIVASLLAESLLALQHRGELLASPGPLVFAGLLAALWPATALAALAVARAAVRTAKVRPAQPPAEPCGDVLDDLARLAGLVRGRVEAGAPALLPAVDLGVRAGRAAALLVERRAPWALAWIDLRRHPWRFCGVVAALAVAATFAGSVVPFAVERPSPLEVALAAALVEGAAVVAGFALLGGFLGIRRPIRLARSLARW